MIKLSQIRKDHGITQAELADMLGVRRSVVSKYESGAVSLTQEMIYKICDIFDVSADYLLGRYENDTTNEYVNTYFKGDREEDGSSDTMMVESVGIPLIGHVHAGSPMLAQENIEEYIPISQLRYKDSEYFFMQVEGDCMTGEYIPEGAYVLVHMQSDVPNGSIGIVRIDDEVLIRTIRKSNGMLVLIAANPAYEPMVISDGDVEIIGKVEEIRIEVR